MYLCQFISVNARGNASSHLCSKAKAKRQTNFHRTNKKKSCRKKKQSLDWSSIAIYWEKRTWKSHFANESNTKLRREEREMSHFFEICIENNQWISFALSMLTNVCENPFFFHFVLSRARSLVNTPNRHVHQSEIYISKWSITFVRIDVFRIG